MKNFTKIFQLLDPKEKKSAYLLLFLIIVMALVDTIGIASVMPFVAVLANPELIETNSVLNKLYLISQSLLGITDSREFLFFLGAFFFILIMFSLIVRAVTTYAQIRFTLMREYTIGKRLVEGYLRQPYIWFLNRHSADLGKSILSELSEVIAGSVIPLITIISQSAVVFFIIILLIIIDPFLSISVGLLLLICYIIIYHLKKKILFNLGNRRLEANTKRFKVINEVFSSMKEVKVGGLEKIYLNTFEGPSKVFAKTQVTQRIISILPRYFIEAIAFGGMILLTLFLMSKNSGFDDIVPIISIYALAGYRLIPAIQGIYLPITQIRFTEASLDNLHKDLISLNRNPKIEIQGNMLKLKKCISLENINFTYPKSERINLKNINLIIPVSSKVGIVGSTGEGKTTLADLILGLLDNYNGILKVDDVKIDDKTVRSWQKMIGYVPQQIFLSDSTIASNIALGFSEEKINLASVENAAKQAKIHDFIKNELPHGYKTKVGERGIRISGGQRQRIGIARALYHNPKVLVFDEATNALDDATETLILDSIQKLNKDLTFIMITHKKDLVKNFDYVISIENGGIKNIERSKNLKKI
tara:strand:+ start:351 stop:2117 length:1767 start_codon:yes stop_codon:yes gene_type:complete